MCLNIFYFLFCTSILILMLLMLLLTEAVIKVATSFFLAGFTYLLACSFILIFPSSKKCLFICLSDLGFPVQCLFLVPELITKDWVFISSASICMDVMSRGIPIQKKKKHVSYQSVLNLF